MPHALENTVSKLRRWAGRSTLAERSDRELLQTFAASGDEAAFTALVRRHGALVYGVTRRVLGNAQDAEDAFQATFLVLARKAGNVAWDESVRNWLHGVAYRVAKKARSQAARRRLKESQASGVPTPPRAESWHELRGILDEELQHLPAKYRVPLILCYLEGKTRDEAAEELGWSPGSLKGRLERGREMLRQRLCRRGLTLPAALCAGFLLDQSAFATAPATLTAATIQHSLQFASGPLTGLAATESIHHLAQGVLQAMLIAKLKFTALVVSAGMLLGSGSLWLGSQANVLAAGPVEAAAALPFDGAQFAGLQDEGERRPERKDADRPRAERKDGDRPRPEVPEKDRPREERKDGDRPRPETKDKDRPREERKDGDRPRGDEDRRREERGERGLVKNIDLKQGTITIQLIRDGESGDRTLNLAGPDIPVLTPFEKKISLAELKPGVRVLLALNDNNDVRSVRVEPISTFGFMLRTDAGKRTITLRMPRQGERAVETTLKVLPDARLTLNGRPAELEAFETGLRVQLQLDMDGQTVLALQGGRVERDGDRPRGEREADGERRGAFHGTIIDVNPSKSTIDVLLGREGNPSIATLTVAKDAAVKVMFLEQPVHELPFAQLAKPVNASLIVDKEKLVSAIHVTAPVQRGRIKSVDAANRTVTLGGEGGGQTLTIDANAKVAQGRRELPLAELDEGTPVMLGLTPDRSRVIGIQIIRGDEER